MRGDTGTVRLPTGRGDDALQRAQVIAAGGLKGVSAIFGPLCAGGSGRRPVQSFTAAADLVEIRLRAPAAPRGRT
jgi:hypothetical protein